MSISPFIVGGELVRHRRGWVKAEESLHYIIYGLERCMEEEYEVPSPHEHAVEEQTENAGNRLAQKIALMTAVLATVGALISYQSGSAQTEAMFLKNESILKQAEASDQWSYYQAKSMKGHIAEATADNASSPQIREKYVAQQAKLEKEKADIQIEAKKLQTQSHLLRPLTQLTPTPCRPPETL